MVQKMHQNGLICPCEGQKKKAACPRCNATMTAFQICSDVPCRILGDAGENPARKLLT
jgi:hypothetical protein